MRKVAKVIGYIVLSLLVTVIVGIAYIFISANKESSKNLKLLGKEAPVLTENGFSFRDLNKNGKLDAYEDTRSKIEDRVSDLLSQMTLEEKAGTMFFNIIKTSSDGELAEVPEFGNLFSFAMPANSEGIAVKKMNHFNLLQTPNTTALATWSNNVQKLAERTRLGIPLTIGT